MNPNITTVELGKPQRSWTPLLSTFHLHELPLFCLALLLGLVGLMAHYSENYVLSLFSVSVALSVVFLIQRRDSQLVWLGNPVRFFLPVFIVFQLLGWARCELIESTRDFIQLRWLWAGYAPAFGREGCATYLLYHLPYFCALHISFRSARESISTIPLDRGRTLNWSVPLLLAALLSFTATYGHESEYPSAVLYFTANVMRFRILFTLMVSEVGFVGASRGLRIAAWVIQAGLFALAFIAVAVTKMRFLVLQHLAAMGLIWASVRARRFSFRSLATTGVAALVGLALFAVITDIKTNAAMDGSDSSPERIAQLADALMFRVASFHAESVLLDRPSTTGFWFDRRAQVVKEVLAGIPMSGLVTNQIVPSNVSLDMEFQWVATVHYSASSYFVSVFTSIRHSFGPFAAFASALLGGLLHGFASRWALAQPQEGNWITVQAAFLSATLHGVQRVDLLGIPVNIVLFMLVLRFLCRRRQFIYSMP